PLIDAAAARRALAYQYREIDPDVFGSELDQRAYARVERIAAVGLTLQVM
ncbi:MAG: SAM-dependent methyltransferase, partial [Burkholderiaceae bacterium]|nr:SAM-dependent methyltransferase [Burkholderiaceae bacterium]